MNSEDSIAIIGLGTIAIITLATIAFVIWGRR